MIFPLNEIYLYTNGVLLSRRYITTEAGTALTQNDINACTLNVYKLEGASNGTYTRTKLLTVGLQPSDVITETVQTDPEGWQYNFRYCVEEVFTQSNTLYLVEYDLVTTEGHHIIIQAKGRTTD
ncbi:MAG: hypothetical protein IJG38_04995 [Thermoguttaceae bacterium]|nr:hypothetical protein [Thermoguttaceae bacterium]